MRKSFIFFLLLTLTLASQGLATETRVESTGNLTLVITDETVEINPFIFGNPAGLALLDPISRFDATGQYLLDSSAATNTTTSSYGMLRDFNTDSPGYHGFIVFPTKEWAFQADGDFQHSENQTNSVLQNQNQDRTREFFRTAYDFGALILGGEVEAQQENITLSPGNFYNTLLVSGQGTQSVLNSQGGLLFSFPANPTPSQERFLFGGSYSRQLVPGQDINKVLVDINPGPTTLSLTETITTANVQSFGPEFYFKVPNSFEMVLLGRYSSGAVSLQIDSSDTTIATSQPAYKVVDGNGLAIAAAFKAKSPLFKTTYLKSGFSFVYSSNNANYYNPGLTTTATNTAQAWKAVLGGGLEGLLDYTVGLQAELDGVNGSYQPTGTSSLPLNLFTVKVSLGGEKWLSKFWAFRTGISFESDNNTGAQPYSLSSFMVPSGQDVISTTISVGGGYKDPNFQTDLLFLFSQPYVNNSPSPNDFMTQIGIQLAASLFFN